MHPGRHLGSLCYGMRGRAMAWHRVWHLVGGKRAQMAKDAGAFVWLANLFLIGEKTIC